MRYCHIFLLSILLIAVGCREKILPKNLKFTARVLTYPFDTTVYKIGWYNGYLICAQHNGKLAIIDTNYIRQPALEQKANKYKFTYMFPASDTIFLSDKKKEYYLDQNFEPRPYRLKSFGGLESLYEDSVYRVDGCCFGEFGGSVFFLDKRTNRMFSYPANCAAQVLRTNAGYLVCTNLAHLSYRTNYYVVKDPLLLHELKYEPQKRYCNWWIDVDSISDWAKRKLLPGMRQFKGPDYGMTIMNFQYEDSTYAIITRDSGVYVNILRDSIYVRKDTLLKHGLNFHELQVISVGKKYISLLNLTSGSLFAAYWVRGNFSALVVANHTGVDFLFKKGNK